MQGLLLWVRVLTCVSLVLFSISCYNMVVRSEVEIGGREPDSQTGALTLVPESEDEDGKDICSGNINHIEIQIFLKAQHICLDLKNQAILRFSSYEKYCQILEIF